MVTFVDIVVQADIGYSVQVRGITLQGRQDADWWVKSYGVKVSTDGDSWHDVTWDGENITVKYIDQLLLKDCNT